MSTLSGWCNGHELSRKQHDICRVASCGCYCHPRNALTSAGCAHGQFTHCSHGCFGVAS